MNIDATVLSEARRILRQSAVEDKPVKLSEVIAVLMQLEQMAIAGSRDNSASAYATAQDTLVAAVSGQSLYRY